jgi:hypothetical protein
LYFCIISNKGDIVHALAGVYTFSFFSSNGFVWYWKLLLKFKRKKLPRPEKHELSVVIAVALIITAFIGNMELNIDSFYTFAIFRYLLLDL